MACPQGLHECLLDTGPVTTERVGSRRAWLGQGSTHAWPLWPSQLGTWLPPTKGTRNNITLGEECTSQPLAGTSCSSLQERPRLALAECVCTRVCVCLVTALSATSSSRDGGGPFLPACPPPRSVFLGLGPHTIIPPVGGLLNFLVYVPQWGNRAFPASPGRVLHPSIHVLTPWLFFSPPRRVGRGRAPRRGAAVGFFLVIGHLLPASPGVF